MFSRSSDMIGAINIFNGSYDLTTSLSSVACDLHIQSVHQFCWRQKTRLPWAITWRCLRDPTFSRFDRIRQTWPWVGSIHGLGWVGLGQGQQRKSKWIRSLLYVMVHHHRHLQLPAVWHLGERSWRVTRHSECQPSTVHHCVFGRRVQRTSLCCLQLPVAFSVSLQVLHGLRGIFQQLAIHLQTLGHDWLRPKWKQLRSFACGSGPQFSVWTVKCNELWWLY